METIFLIIVLFGGYVNNATGQSWIQKGQDIDGESSGDGFGHSINMTPDGNTIVIGGLNNDGNGSNAGYVQIYEWDTSTNNWIQKGLDIDGDTIGDLLGQSVDISFDGNTIIMGAIGNDGNANNTGRVKIYEWNNTSWVQKGQNIDGESSNDGFGYSVSMSSDGNKIAISAINDDQNGSNSGHVRIYEWNNTNWIQKGQDIDGEASYDRSGRSISMDSSAHTLAIGAINNNGNGYISGHVRVYEWDSTGTNWAQKGQDIDGEMAQDLSGQSVSLSLDGNILAIGATGNDDSGPNSGHARIYEWDSTGTSWVQKGQDIDGENGSDRSGFSVNIDANGNTIMIGAMDNSGNGLSSGHVRVYEWNNTSWVQKGQDIDGEALSDLSGNAVSMNVDGSTIAIGASHNSGNGINSGHVRIYSYCTSSSFTDAQSACSPYTWIDGNTYTSSIDSVTYTLTNQKGCDSVITLDLTVLPNTSGIDIQSACGSYTWIDGNTYTSSNTTVTYLLTNQFGCDSVVTLDLTLSPNTSGIDVQSACGSYTWIDGNTYTSSNTTATYLLTNQFGCDSIITLDLTIDMIDNTISQNGFTLKANEIDFDYQWLDCSNSFSIISNETSQTYSANGDFAVEISKNNCVDTSACFSVRGLGVIESNFSNELTVYPNPTERNITIDLGENYLFVDAKVFDVEGKLLRSNRNYDLTNVVIEIEGETGIYFVEVVTSSNEKALLKIFKK